MKTRHPARQKQKNSQSLCKDLENETRSFKEENTNSNSKLDLISQENLSLKQQIVVRSKIKQEQSLQDFKEIEEQQQQQPQEQEQDEQELQEEEKMHSLKITKTECKIEQYEQNLNK
ncbi:hypothetical protein M0813_16721 [Anaeramoeba flamelloides]|uniref:Uncharacterized protein n=1 Tax=Anaeramoeba flamelloides TaxID=1746091 RepID=A0ABQ8YZP9_9EUKA|nr:hypothetical protein M0813_16721 [Anaeramoeba flamelloides]